jgi:hypothetical protein
MLRIKYFQISSTNILNLAGLNNRAPLVSPIHNSMNGLKEIFKLKNIRNDIFFKLKMKVAGLTAIKGLLNKTKLKWVLFMSPRHGFHNAPDNESLIDIAISEMNKPNH